LPVDSMILMLLIGLAFGGISAVFLRGKSIGFFVNVLLGVLGAALGAYLPVLMGTANSVDVSNFAYLMRALMGSFVLVLLATLFRPARPPGS